MGLSPHSKCGQIISFEPAVPTDSGRLEDQPVLRDGRGRKSRSCPARSLNPYPPAMKSTGQSKWRSTHEYKSNDLYRTPSFRTWRITASFSELLIYASKSACDAIAFCSIGSVGIGRYPSSARG